MSHVPRTPVCGLARRAVVDACRVFDSWLGFQRGRLRVPGVQAAVLHTGSGFEPGVPELVLSTGHGVASLETGELRSDRHLFRIAPHSKTFTATATAVAWCATGGTATSGNVGHSLLGLLIEATGGQPYDADRRSVETSDRITLGGGIRP